MVGGRTPAIYHSSKVSTTIGQKLLMIGFPDSLPAKVEDGGMVTNTGSSNGYEFFTASTDSFGGGRPRSATCSCTLQCYTSLRPSPLPLPIPQAIQAAAFSTKAGP